MLEPSCQLADIVMRQIKLFIICGVVAACGHAEADGRARLSSIRGRMPGDTGARNHEAQPARLPSENASQSTPTCGRPERGIIVGHDTVAGFSTHDTLGALRRQCDVGKADIYDATGWQAVAWTFPFVGARVMAVQTHHPYGEAVRNDEVPDLWIVRGDSVRLPDGELLPPTLGALRARYGYAIVDDNVQGDDVDDPHARSCRYAYLRFSLAVKDTARKISDSARVTGVDMDTPGIDTVRNRLCAEQSTPRQP